MVRYLLIPSLLILTISCEIRDDSTNESISVAFTGKTNQRPAKGIIGVIFTDSLGMKYKWDKFPESYILLRSDNGKETVCGCFRYTTTEYELDKSHYKGYLNGDPLLIKFGQHTPEWHGWRWYPDHVCEEAGAGCTPCYRSESYFLNRDNPCTDCDN